MHTQTPSIVGADVYHAHGEKIGRADRVYLDSQTTRQAWVTVMTGLFGTHRSFIPLVNADITNSQIFVPFSKEHVRDSPTAEPVGTHLTPDDEHALIVHYGLSHPT